MFPLLETFYDSKHPAHVLVDRGEISICVTKYFNLYFYFCPLTTSLFPYQVVQSLRAHTHSPLRWDERYVPYHRWAGMLCQARVVCTGLPAMNAPPLTAFVDRWRPETHSFHLPCGEVTITMQDVTMILGLPLEGNAVTSIV